MYEEGRKRCQIDILIILRIILVVIQIGRPNRHRSVQSISEQSLHAIIGGIRIPHEVPIGIHGIIRGVGIQRNRHARPIKEGFHITGLGSKSIGHRIVAIELDNISLICLQGLRVAKLSPRLTHSLIGTRLAIVFPYDKASVAACQLDLGHLQVVGEGYEMPIVTPSVPIEGDRLGLYLSIHQQGGIPIVSKALRFPNLITLNGEATVMQNYSRSIHLILIIYDDITTVNNHKSIVEETSLQGSVYHTNLHRQLFFLGNTLIILIPTSKQSRIIGRHLHPHRNGFTIISYHLKKV